MSSRNVVMRLAFSADPDRAEFAVRMIQAGSLAPLYDLDWTADSALINGNPMELTDEPDTQSAIHRGAVTEEMTTRAWQVLADRDLLPYMARSRDFTDAQVAAGELHAADQEADAMNRAFVRSIIEAALGITADHT